VSGPHRSPLWDNTSNPDAERIHDQRNKRKDSLKPPKNEYTLKKMADAESRLERIVSTDNNDVKLIKMLAAQALAAIQSGARVLRLKEHSRKYSHE
jgi:hypothetical protein